MLKHISNHRAQTSYSQTHNPQPTTHNPQPTTHNPQPTTHNPQPTTHNPQNLWSAKVIFGLLISCFLWMPTAAYAQCNCGEDLLLEVSFTQPQPPDTFVPFCDVFRVNISIFNLSDDTCEVSILLRVLFITTNEAPNFEPLKPIRYLGDLPLQYDITYNSVPGINPTREFGLVYSGVLGPVGGVGASSLRFTIEPYEHFAPNEGLRIVVIGEPLDPACPRIPLFEGGTTTLGFHHGLYETPISGRVSELIAALRLQSNSCVSTITERKIIQGELEVDTDYCFRGTPSFRSFLYLLPGAQVVVRSGATLTLDMVSVFTCDTLARGIVVEPGGTLIVRGSSLEDCRFAIDARPNSTVRVEGSFLANNYVGMRFDMQGAPAPARVNQLILGNSFTTTRPLKKPYAGMPDLVETRGYCGILLYDYDDFNVFGSQTNSFSRLANGIVGFNSTGNIGNMTFTDMNSADGISVYPREGYGVYLSATRSGRWFNINQPWTVMVFDSMKTAVYGASLAGKVEGIRATRVDVGIHWERSITRDVRLLRNDIAARRAGVLSWRNEPLRSVSEISDNRIVITAASADLGPGLGIWLDELGIFPPSFTWRGWQLLRDTVVLRRGGTGIGYRKGTRGWLLDNLVRHEAASEVFYGIVCESVRNSIVGYNRCTGSSLTLEGAGILNRGGTNIDYICNVVNNTQRGMLFQDLGNLQDLVRGNSFNRHITGLQIDPGAAIGTQFHTGNLWNLQFIDPDQGILGGRCFGEVEQSRFRVDGSEDPAQNPPVDPVGWFVNEPSPGTYRCDPSFEFGSETDDPTGLDVVVASGGAVSDVYATEMAWKAAYRLYRKLLRQPELLQDSLFAAFAAYHATRSTGRLAAVAEAAGQLFALTPAQDSLLSLYRAEQEDKAEQLRHLDSLRHAGQSVSAAVYQAAQVASAQAREQYETYADALIAARRAQAAVLAVQNSGIAADALPATNHKAVNAALLHLLQTDTLSAADAAVLEGIAGQCPLEGGDAVYEARALLGGGVYYDDDVLCDLAQWRSRELPPAAVQTQVSRAMLYPNPASEMLYWSGAQSVRVRLFNAMGQLAVEQLLVGNALPIGLLPEGLYVAQVFDAQAHTLLAVQKVVLKR
ncbi:MAG: T9SS type A sorting domain-containing protein [Saprospiraceae bacterium]|nr:T9SS type A sorting domain-containing protein [Saprospiraceae bacterium]MDW8230168.1 T9SS type A sorting domain-containing protein [Saprospiraceae bacterium]